MKANILLKGWVASSLLMMVFSLRLLGSDIKSNKQKDQEPRLSVDYQEVALSEVISDLKKRYSYTFFYSESVIALDKKISFKAKKKKENDVFKGIFYPNNIDFVVIEKKVILKKSKTSGKIGKHNKSHEFESKMEIYAEYDNVLKDSINILKQEIASLNKKLDSLLAGGAKIDTLVIVNTSKPRLNDALKVEIENIKDETNSLADRLSDYTKEKSEIAVEKLKIAKNKIASGYKKSKTGIAKKFKKDKIEPIPARDTI